MKNNLYKKIIVLIASISLVTINNPIFAQVKVEEEIHEIEDTTDRQDLQNSSKHVEETMEDLDSDINNEENIDIIEKDELEELTLDEGVNVMEKVDEKSAVADNLQVESKVETINSKTTDENGFILFPKPKANTPATNTNFDETVVHTINGLDTTFPEGFHTETNSARVSAGTYSYNDLIKKNFQLKEIRIPEIKVYLKDGTPVTSRIYLHILTRNIETGKLNSLIKTYDSEFGNGINITEAEINMLRENKNLTEKDEIAEVQLNYGSNLVTDWSNPDIKATLPGGFNKIEFPQGIEFEWLYRYNETYKSLNGFETIPYYQKFSSEIPGSRDSQSFELKSNAFIYPLTANAVVDSSKIEDTITIGEEFKYDLNIINDTNIGNEFAIYFPKVKGLSFKNIQNDDIVWTEFETVYGAHLSRALQPNESFNTEIILELDSTYEHSTYSLDLLWNSVYSDYDNAKLIDGNRTLNINFGSSTVTFESNGGSNVEALKVENKQLIEKPADPVRKGYQFDGWFKDSNFETEWNFAEDIVTQDLTLYAKWSKNPVITVDKLEIDYVIGSKITVKQFLKDINAIAPKNLNIVVTNFDDINFNKVGTYTVELSLATYNSSETLSITVNVLEKLDQEKPGNDKDTNIISNGNSDISSKNQGNASTNNNETNTPHTGLLDNSNTFVIILMSMFSVLSLLLRKRVSAK